MTPIFEGQLPKTRPFPIKTGIIKGLQVYIDLHLIREFQLAQLGGFSVFSDFKLLEWHIGWQQARSMLWDTWISHGLKMRMLLAHGGVGNPGNPQPSWKEAAHGWHDMFSLHLPWGQHPQRPHTLHFISCKLGESHTKTSPTNSTYASLGSKKTQRGGGFSSSQPFPQKKKSYTNVYFFLGVPDCQGEKKEFPKLFWIKKNDLGFVGRSWNLQIKKPTKTQKLHFVLYSYWLRIRLVIRGAQ